MPIRIVYRDQAVWEREFIQIEVPDDVPDDELDEYIEEVMDAPDYTPVYLCEPEIQDSVEGIDTIIEVQPL